MEERPNLSLVKESETRFFPEVIHPGDGLWNETHT